MELGATFKPCFDIRRSRLPCSHLNLKTRAADFRDISTAEAGTLQLELRDLTRTTKIRFYEVHFFFYINVYRAAGPLVKTALCIKTIG